jgi:hypothetical protein
MTEIAEDDPEDPHGSSSSACQAVQTRRRATKIPLRLTERQTPFLVDSEMFFEESDQVRSNIDACYRKRDCTGLRTISPAVIELESRE